MIDSHDRLLELIRLIYALEAACQYVTVARLRRAARAQIRSSTLSDGMARLVTRAVGLRAIYSDNRLELTRTGSFRPIRIYRVNRRHSLVEQALGGPCAQRH